MIDRKDLQIRHGWVLADSVARDCEQALKIDQGLSPSGVKD